MSYDIGLSFLGALIFLLALCLLILLGDGVRRYFRGLRVRWAARRRDARRAQRTYQFSIPYWMRDLKRLST